ncbi:hypothetical protein BVC80_1751g52 [Macleaya cordata]|uniref:Protamine P1 n=1 Tax=Macleaya cordata TaxID=56857 RepID=A0A200QHL3_MACCD|nr:hypothetical protein BVC80_1751g52 [Macleaya cordata]
MKLSSKPISSPGRTEKFPPPLMRFLKSNGGSRSRGRSRSSPMFVRKKNASIETQEPSSPKVTCMGQVRVRRCKQASRKNGRTKRSDPCRNSSMLNRFWSSPSTTEDSEQNNRAHVENEEEEQGNEKPTSKKEPICIDSASISRSDPEAEEKIGFCESSSSERSSAKTSKIKDEEVMKVSGEEERPPLTLTRCKSEPGRRLMKVDTETCFWKKRKSGFNEQCPPHILL